MFAVPVFEDWTKMFIILEMVLSTNIYLFFVSVITEFYLYWLMTSILKPLGHIYVNSWKSSDKIVL